MTTPAPAFAFATGLVLRGRYRLEKPVEIGPVAEVWTGHDLVLQREVAIKLLQPHLAEDEDLAERFRREAMTAARLTHPNIVPTYDTGTDDEATYIVLGLVHGQSLDELINTDTVVEPRVAVFIARQVADALDNAHRAGIVHRSVRPSNVLAVGDDHRVMVTDFGMAKAVDEGSDESLSVVNLAPDASSYLAPEQRDGKSADARSDIYATGVLLRQLASGNAPLENGKTTPLPQGISEIVAKATDDNPTNRYQSAASLSDELSILEHSYTAAERGSAPQRMSMPAPKAPRKLPERSVPVEDEATAPHRALPPQPSQSDEPTRSVPATGANQRHDSPTPPPAPAPELPVKSRRGKLIAIGVAVFLVIGAVALGRTLAVLSSDPSSTTATTSPTPLRFTSAAAFDPPPGDGTENNAQLSNAIDEDPSTTWATSTYASRKLGNLKPGVGLVLQLQQPTELKVLQVETASEDWSASIYVADSPRATLAAWGPPVDTQSGLGGSARFDMHQKTGSAVLVWFTDLGTANRVTVADTAINP